MTRMLLTALLWLAPVIALAAEPVTRVPYRIDYGGWFTVSATVNGRGPYDFIIDTGASHSLVFENLAKIHEFPPSGGEPQLVLGIASSAYYPTYSVGDIAVGPAVLKDAATVIIADWTVDERAPQGVLGLDFLTQFRLLFDDRAQELTIYALDTPLPRANEQWRAAPLEGFEFNREAGEMFVISARMNRATVRFILDLGAAGTVINTLAFRRIREREPGLEIVIRSSGRATGRIIDALDTTVRTHAVRVNSIRTDRINWGGAVVVIHDASIFAELGVDGEPFGLFGSDMFRNRSFVLDFSRKRVLVGPRTRRSR